jgi:hypothetical protein
VKHNEYNFQNSAASGNNQHNYVKQWSFFKENVSPTDNFNAFDRKDKSEVIQFTDGLGRPIQTIGVGMATNQGDIISHYEYDQYGRKSKSFLPFVISNNNGNYFTTAAIAQKNFNYAEHGTFNSFSENAYDNSPMNKVIEQGAPGDEWQIGTGHTAKIEE